MSAWLIPAITLTTAFLLYTVLLPHVEGPSLEEQAADHKVWLVCCPQCETWQTIAPRASSESEKRMSTELETSYTNWYTCGRCQHRWQEEHPLI